MESNPSIMHAFCLRSIGLHAKEIGQREQEGTIHAQIMAETLANLYWGAHVHANDLEFCLAPASR